LLVEQLKSLTVFVLRVLQLVVDALVVDVLRVTAHELVAAIWPRRITLLAFAKMNASVGQSLAPGLRGGCERLWVARNLLSLSFFWPARRTWDRLGLEIADLDVCRVSKQLNCSIQGGTGILVTKALYAGLMTLLLRW